MIIFNRQFKPSWLMLFIMLSSVGLFAALGFWQLDRAGYKQLVEDKYESRLAADYVPFKATENWSEIEYQKVILQGQFDTERTLLLDNQLYKGRAGYHVISPFTLSTGDVVLVNRGWVAAGVSRQILPAIEMPVNQNLARGVVTIPGDDIYRMGDIFLEGDWPQVIPFIDIPILQAEFESRLFPIVVWLGAEQQGAYIRDWQPVWLKPEKSRAYAWQWFAFAAIALILFFVLNLRKLHD
ncbi:MAG: SURF1 family protein [Gammaproteobacteria bacterium]|nr:SURF1 family protein [Gammaproteobacteria bacterium]